MNQTRDLHEIIFKRLRRPSVCEVLRLAVNENPSAIPYVLFKTVFRYPIYLFIFLIFVKNLRALAELFLYRNAVRVLDFRLGLGRFRLNIYHALVIAALILNGIYSHKIGEKVVARFRGGCVSSPDPGFLSFLTEPYEEMYHCFSYAGKVLDVGGYLGETAALFGRWGAREVVVYEPDRVLAQHARKTLRLNGVRGVVYELSVNCSGSNSSISWVEVLKEKFDIAKVDCEGCEDGLTRLPDELIRSVPKWIIECHGPRMLKRLCEKFSRAGFVVTFKPYNWKGGYHLLGRERSFTLQVSIPEGFHLFVMRAHLPNTVNR